MSQKKHAHKTKLRPAASRPAPASPGNPSLKHNTRGMPPAPRKSASRDFKKSTSLNPLLLIAGGLVAVGLIILAIYLLNRKPEYTNSLPDTISVAEAYQEYQAGTFLLDVRTQDEWNEYHVPDTTHIPLDELESRLSELPQGQDIVVICRSGNRSQQGRDALLKNGFTAVTSMAGGLKEWSAAGYPIDGTRP